MSTIYSEINNPSSSHVCKFRSYTRLKPQILMINFKVLQNKKKVENINKIIDGELKAKISNF